MAEEKIDFATLNIDTDALETRQARLIKQVTELREAQKSLKKETDNLSTATDEQAKTYVNNDAQLKKLNSEYSQQKAILAEVRNGTKGLTEALTRQNKTEAEAQKNNSQLIKLRKQLDKTTKEGQKATEDINKKIDENNKFLKENGSQLEQQRLNIGNYTSALDNVVPGLGRFVQGLSATRLAMLAIPLVALISGIAALVKAFASTQAGMDKINQLLAPLKGGFEAFVGVVQDLALNIFSQLGDRATIAIGSIEKGINNVRILYNKFTGDLEKAAELIEANEQITTNQEVAQTRLNKKTSDFLNILDGANQRIKQGGETQKEIERLELRIRKIRTESIVPLAKAENELRKLKQKGEDVSRSEQERLAAIQKAEDLQRFITGEKQKELDLIIKKTELENSLNDTSAEAEIEYQELLARRYKLEDEGTKRLTTLQNQRNTIQAKIVAKAEKEIMLNNQAVEQTRQAFLDELDIIIETAETEIEVEEKVTAAKKAQEAERIKNEIEAANQRVEIIRSTANEAVQIFGETSKAGKAAAIFEIQLANGQALAKGIAAAQSVPFPGNLLAIATTISTIASNFRRVRQITRGAKEPNIKKFAKGGLMEVGGQRHSAGGTRFMGEDGTEFEAEKGEMIGVLNRGAAKMFMDFNNRGMNSMYASMLTNGIGSKGMLSDRGIIGAIRETTGAINRKPVAYPNITKDGIYTVVTDGQTLKKINQDYYHG